MTVRATATGHNPLIDDLLALQNAERVICRMTHEEIMGCMQLGLVNYPLRPIALTIHTPT